MIQVTAVNTYLRGLPIPCDGEGLLADSIDQRIAINLRNARQDAGLTQRDVERRIGVTQQTVSGWERGKNLPNIANLAALIRLYGCTANDIFGDMQAEGETPEQIIRKLQRLLGTQADP